MKKWTLLALILVGMTVYAQEENAKREMRKSPKEQMTPEQKADLKTKRMTLTLDLNEKQQKEVKELLLASSKNDFKEKKHPEKKKAAKETNTSGYDKMSKRLDEQIKFKKEMKNILTPEQFEKWETSKSDFKRKHYKRKKAHK